MYFYLIIACVSHSTNCPGYILISPFSICVICVINHHKPWLDPAKNSPELGFIGECEYKTVITKWTRMKHQMISFF